MTFFWFCQRCCRVLVPPSCGCGSGSVPERRSWPLHPWLWFNSNDVVSVSVMPLKCSFSDLLFACFLSSPLSLLRSPPSDDCRSLSSLFIRGWMKQRSFLIFKTSWSWKCFLLSGRLRGGSPSSPCSGQKSLIILLQEAAAFFKI